MYVGHMQILCHLCKGLEQPEFGSRNHPRIPISLDTEGQLYQKWEAAASLWPIFIPCADLGKKKYWSALGEGEQRIWVDDSLFETSALYIRVLTTVINMTWVHLRNWTISNILCSLFGFFYPLIKQSPGSLLKNKKIYLLVLGVQFNGTPRACISCMRPWAWSPEHGYAHACMYTPQK